MLPYIIGKKGVNLKNIQDISGANIQVPKRGDIDIQSIAGSDDIEEDSVEITIEGVDEGVRIASSEINKIIDEKVPHTPNIF